MAQFATAGADPASVFADRYRYEEYLPRYGNVSYESRHDYWTSPVEPPAGSGREYGDERGVAQASTTAACGS